MFALLAILPTAHGADPTIGTPCDSTAPPEPGPTPAPVCMDKPLGWTSSDGKTCEQYATDELCTEDGGYGPGWESEWGTFEDYNVNGVSAIIACCSCGGGSKISSNKACEGHSFNQTTCEAIGCCHYHAIFGCHGNFGDAPCYPGPCDTTIAPGPGIPGIPGKAVVGGVIAGGAALAAAGAMAAAGSTTTLAPTMSTMTTIQNAQTSPPPVSFTTTDSSSSSGSLWWLWLLLALIACCCLLGLCGGLAAMVGGKKKKHKQTRSTRGTRIIPEDPPIDRIEEQQQLLPGVPPLTEPYPMGAPMMTETIQPVQMVPMAAGPTIVETVAPMTTTTTTPVFGAPAMMVIQ